jgi:uncharacterized protein
MSLTSPVRETMKIGRFNKPKENLKDIDILINESWKTIAPFWPLKNLIAVNPLQGFEDLPIEKAMLEGATLFEQDELPIPMACINRQTIKWMQAFFDEGQATIPMPLRTEGLYTAWKKLVLFDEQIHKNCTEKKYWLSKLSCSPKKSILECLFKLKIPTSDQSLFLTLMLCTLPGWASHIKYRTNWTAGETAHAHPVTATDYLAIRLILACLLWEEAGDLVTWYKKNKDQQIKKGTPILEIKKTEAEYLKPLLNKLAMQRITERTKPDAQLIFCIDVRSEPFRRAIESVGEYETFGFAGFFGLPVRIKNSTTKEVYTSCPVLIQPKHTVNELPSHSNQACNRDYKRYLNLKTIKSLYQSLKYNITTSFALVELLGFAAGFWMALRTILPIASMKTRNYINNKIRPAIDVSPCLEDISFTEQCLYAETALRAIGLTNHFSSLIVFCGHGSATQNNAYATALDCGACGGRHGSSNARILAKILNTKKIREALQSKGINIPKTTYFMAAKHNTTTDIVEMYAVDKDAIPCSKLIQKLKNDLKKAGEVNCSQRAAKMGFIGNVKNSTQHTKQRSIDWAQVRPEWGLAQNASFIVAPRKISKSINLEGRAFLHSYDYHQDPDGTILTLILTAPMVVAQWINSQYLFSTLDNVAYGSGSKITKNITGKIGIMQGNASDLMNGLPLQSVCKSDTEAYHSPVRLMTIVYAPCDLIDKVIKRQPVLQKLFGNGWVMLSAIDPKKTNSYFILNRDLSWKRITSGFNEPF